MLAAHRAEAEHLEGVASTVQRLAALRPHVAAERLITDPTRTLAYGTDASFYRLLPQIVVCAIDEMEVAAVLRLAHAHGVAVTLRAAGTSLSGQAVSDSVLVIIQEGWTGIQVLDGGARIRLQPGVIGQHANDALRRYGRKIGPDLIRTVHGVGYRLIL